MKNVLCFIILYLLSFPSLSGIIGPPELLFVGQGGGVCIYTNIQDAIDNAPPNSEIRVTREVTHFENLIIDKSLTINGGYTNCGFAQLDSRLDENRTLVNAGGVANALVVTGNSITVSLTGITLFNGLFESIIANQASGGSVSILADNSHIIFDQTNISGSEGFTGGGIFMGADNIQLTLSNTVIDTNTAANGGGVFCQSSGILEMEVGSGITGNTANGVGEFGGFGGGIFATDCTLSLKSGEGGDQAFHLVGISNNFSNNSGGGIYADNSNLVNVVGFTGILNIDHNIANIDMNATGDGGGIYLTAGSTIQLYRYYFDSNTVFNGSGGALYLDNSKYISGSNLNIYDECILQGLQECNLFINNKAVGPPGFGGAISMNNFSVPLSSDDSIRARFINNRANNGSALSIVTGSKINIQNAYFIDNGNNGFDDTGDSSVIRIADINSEVSLYSSTLANNKTQNVFSLVSDGILNLINSIVFEKINPNLTITNDVILNTGGTFAYGCSLFHEEDTIGIIPPFNSSIVSTNPGFVNPTTDDYHITLDSIAIDRCANAGIPITLGADYDGNIRPIDSLGISNGIGKYDAGADENNDDIGISDIVFNNGFE